MGSRIAWLVACLLLAGAGGDPAGLEVFTRPGCPHCAAAAPFVAQLEAEGVRVARHDIIADPAARRRLHALAAEAGVLPGVPAFLIDGQLIVGFDEERVRAALGGGAPGRGEVESGLFGRISVDRLGLPLFTVVLGLLDGFNPCAMWVLLFLLAMLVNLRSRSRMALIAGTFVLVSGAVYFAFMAAWLNVFLIVGVSRTLEIGLGVVALAMAAINVKDFFAFKRGLSLTIPDRAKPGLYARVRAILRQQALAASLAGVVVLAVVVNFIELLCTAGLPAIYTAVLAERALPGWQRYGYLALYNLAYVVDDAVMVGIAVWTLQKTKLTETGGRWLKLVSGLVMGALALALLWFPGWLR